MHTEFRKAEVPRETRNLIAFDRKAFQDYPGDWFDRAAWEAVESWWMLANGRKIGCCAFVGNVDFQEDIREDAINPAQNSSLYVATSGLLPAFQGFGFGQLMKAWQIAYARRRGFSRMVTNTRKSNLRMIRLNQKFGFRVVRTTANYYESPSEPTVVMELQLMRREV